MPDDVVECPECGSENIIHIINPIYGCWDCGHEFGPDHPEELPSLRDS